DVGVVVAGADAEVDGGGSAVETTVVVTFCPATVLCTVLVTIDGCGAAAAFCLPLSRVKKYAASAPAIAASASSAAIAGQALRLRGGAAHGRGGGEGGASHAASSLRRIGRVAAVAAAGATIGSLPVWPAASASAARIAATNSAPLPARSAGSVARAVAKTGARSQ